MVFDSLMLKAVLDELNQRLMGAQLAGVDALDRSTILLRFRTGSGPVQLVCSAEPAFARIHLSATAKPAKLQLPFVQELRRRLGHARLVTCVQYGFERICSLKFNTLDELSEPAAYELVLELTGRHSNLFLMDEGQRIAAVLKPASSARTGSRNLVPGAERTLPPNADDPAPWELPFPELKQALLASGGARWTGTLQRTVTGMSSVLLAELAARAHVSSQTRAAELTEDDWRRIKQTLEWLEHTVRERDFAPVRLLEAEARVKCYPVLLESLPAEWQEAVPDLMSALDEAVREAHLKQRVHVLRTSLAARARAALKRVWRASEKAARELDTAERGDLFKRAGDLLMTFSNQVPASARRVELQDPVTQEAVEIELEKGLSVYENAAHYYKRYKRAERALKVLPARLAVLRERAQQIEKLLAEVEAVPGLEELQSLESQIKRAAPVAGRQDEEKRDAKLKKLGLAPRLFTSPGGFEVLVGRNAEENDGLTFRYAQSHDLWLHCRGAEGSHVILRTGGRPERVQPHDLKFAAQLAAQYSRDRHSALVPVDYTERRYVRKIKGAGPGAAHYSREKTLFVAPASAPGTGP